MKPKNLPSRFANRRTLPARALRHFTRCLTRRRVVFTAITAFSLVLGLGWTWLFADLPAISGLQAGMALPSTRIVDRHGRLLYEVIAETETGGRNTVIPLSDIPAACVQATIATEDANFYQHPGVDLAGVVRALWLNVQGGEVVAGGSTITQQVARNLLLDADQRSERSFRRKVREMALALQLQAAYSKDEVLALYLNQSYYGHLAYGIDAAARAYFGKPASALSLAECAMLAGLPQAPAAYDPLMNLPAAQERQSVVLRLMAENGVITDAQAESARAEPLQFAAAPFQIAAPHFVMAVLAQLERGDYGADVAEAFRTRGLVVTTTLDLDWQTQAEQIVVDQLAALNNPANGTPANAHNAALVSLDPHTGEVRALVGSPDYFDETIDGAVNAAFALRQPGSTLKPFTYAAAFDPTRPDAWTAATMLLDVETPFVTRRLESYTPANYGRVEHGPVLAREALASSLNIPAVLTLEHVGIGTMVDLAADAGLTTLAGNTNLDLAVTLGGGEVRLIDLAGAYGAFANGGLRVQPQFVGRITVADGETLYERAAPPQTRVLDARVAALITDILSDDGARITGFGRHSALNIGRPAAAKTGTTTDYRDNWVVGYTPELLTAVWVGNADNTPMVEVTGVSGAAPIWNAFMRAALNGTPETPFRLPPGLVQVRVCALSGLLPTPDCPATRDEWFIEGTQPTATDTMWQRMAVDRETGLLADDSTPPEQRGERVFAVLPPEARDWAIRNHLPLPPANWGSGVGEQGSGEIQTSSGRDNRVQVRLLEPDPYTIFQIAPTLPGESQRIRLHAAVPGNTRAVTYRLDGETVGVVSEAGSGGTFPLWWPLQAGDHALTAEALLADGSMLISDPLPFTVLDYTPPQSYTVCDGSGC